MRRRLVLACVVALGCAAGAEEAMRTATATRSRGAADSLRVRLDLSGGQLRMLPADEGELYDYSMRYDAARYDVERRFDSASHTLSLRLGGGRRRLRGWSESDREHARVSLALARGVPMDVALRLGAVEADLDLGGLAVDELNVESAASSTSLRFPTPNPRRMRSLRFDAGAASIEAAGIGNANVEHLDVDCGAGGVTLDFSGAWAADADARIRVRLGSVTLRVPRDVGVRARVDMTLGTFENDEFRERDGVHYSSNWDGAQRRLSVDARIVLGTLEIERID
ncbi:MAG: LiaF domain-containing protein [Gemmatimonadaceae bacterium]